MKGIITAAGSGTRLLPITKIVNKTLLLAYDKPVISYAIQTLVISGVLDVLIVVQSSHLHQFRELLGDGKQFGLKSLTIVAKDHTLGMPYSIRQAKEWAKGESIMVVPGDNIFLQSFEKEINKFKSGAIVFQRKVKDPSRFGVPIYKNKKIVDLVEKPTNPQTNYALVAPYIFDNRAYDYIDSLKPSKRGELEIIDLLKKYMQESSLSILKKSGFWKDVGTPDALLEVGVYLKRSTEKNKIN